MELNESIKTSFISLNLEGIVACNASSIVPNVDDKIIAMIIADKSLTAVVLDIEKNISAAKMEYSIKWPMIDNVSEEARDGLDDWYRITDIQARGNSQYNNFLSRRIQ